MVAIRDFSGLVSSPWALARAAAMAPIDSLERCIGHLHQVEADGAGFGAFCPEAMSDRLLGILRHQFLELGLGALMFLKGRSGPSEGCCEFRPTVRCGHIDDADRLQPWPWGLDAKQPRRLAVLDAVPELLLCGEQH